jgi:SAM-dependent methyltransferase
MQNKPGGHALWDLFAAEYADHAEHGAFNALYDRPAVLGLLGDVNGRRVLDAGCGPGLYAEELLRRGASVVGFDQSPEMVRLAQQRLGDAAEFRVQDLGEPIRWAGDASFDLAVMALVIHHVDDRVGALREICRVLRPPGRLVLSTHHPTADWRRRGGSYFDTEVIEETRLARQVLAAATHADLCRVRRSGFLDRAHGRAAASPADGCRLPGRSRATA